MPHEGTAALWKDWDDYLENLSGHPKVNFVESSHSYAKYLRERAEKSLTLRDFCQGLTNDVPRVVRYWAGTAAGGNWSL